MLLRGVLTVGVSYFSLTLSDFIGPSFFPCSCDGLSSEDLYIGKVPIVVLLIVRMASRFFHQLAGQSASIIMLC